MEQEDIRPQIPPSESNPLAEKRLLHQLQNVLPDNSISPEHGRKPDHSTFSSSVSRRRQEPALLPLQGQQSAPTPGVAQPGEHSEGHQLGPSSPQDTLLPSALPCQPHFQPSPASLCWCQSDVLTSTSRAAPNFSLCCSLSLTARGGEKLWPPGSWLLAQICIPVPPAHGSQASTAIVAPPQPLPLRMAW